jgi:signal peptidase I
MATIDTTITSDERMVSAATATTATGPRGLAGARRVVALGARIVGWLLLLVVAAGAGLLVVVPRITGGHALTVLTSSMTPTIPAGSVVLIRPLDYDDVEVGDVITYQREPTKPALVTHRVVDIDATTDPRTLIFRGDANNIDDDPVAEGAIRGRVWMHVPYLGYVRQWIASPRGLLILVAVAMSALLLQEPDRSKTATGDRSSRLAIAAVRLPEAADPATVATAVRGIHLEDAGTRHWFALRGTAAQLEESTARARLLRAGAELESISPPVDVATEPDSGPRHMARSRR